MAQFIDPTTIKKPGLTEYFTKEQIIELKKCKKDPYYFIENYCTVINGVTGKEIPMKLYPYQRRMIEAAESSQYSINLFGRQMGKTEGIVSYMLWWAIFKKNQNIIIAAHNFDHTSEVMGRLKQVYEGLPDWIKSGVKEYNKKTIIFENNSKIQCIATTGRSGRGKSIHFLYIDEFAFVIPSIAKEYWASIQPTLSTTKGKCIITSTPSSDDDEFAQIWHAAIDTLDQYGNEHPDGMGRNGFKATFARWDEHPDRDEQWKADQYAKVGDERFRREHNCEFISFDETLLNPVWIAENLNKMGAEPIRKSGQVRWYKEIKKNKTYVVSLDPSLGTGNDFSAIQVFQLPELIQVAEWRHNKTRAKSQIAVLMEILKEIYAELEDYSPEIYWSVENNTIGETSLYIIDETGEEMFPGVFLTEIRRKGNSKLYRKGYNTSNKKKVEACSRMKTLLEEGKMDISSKALIGELKFFVAKGNGYEAKSGKTDDLVSAVLLAIRMMQDLMEYDADLRESVAQNIGDELGETLEPMPTLML